MPSGVTIAITSAVFRINALKRASAERVASPVWTATESAVAIAWRANRRPAEMQTTQAMRPAGSPKLPLCSIRRAYPASIKAA